MSKKKQGPSAILCADLHITSKQPVSRTDDYLEAMKKKLVFITELRNKYRCPILCAGDVFDKARSPKHLDIMISRILPGEDFHAIPGQHDLPNHALSKFGDSSIGVLSLKSQIVENEFESMYVLKPTCGGRKVGMIHKLLHAPGDPVKAGKDTISYSAKKIMKEYKDLDLIVSGDNHKTFVIEEGGRLLVNPGSMMRMTAGQIDHRPCVFLYFAEDNRVEPVYLPIEAGVISREHIEKQDLKEERVDAFVSRLKDGYELSIDFKQNVLGYFSKNNTRQSVKDFVYDCINDEY